MRKLLMLAIAVVASMAFASSASATSSVEVVEEGTATHCSVASANCTAHIVNNGLVELERHGFFGHVHELDCNNEYTMKLNEDGSGQIDGFSFTGGDADCTDIVACNQPWTFTGEEDGAETGEILVDACFDTGVITCSGNIDITLTDNHDHSYSGSAVDQRVGSSICEVTGSWDSESANFDLVH